MAAWSPPDSGSVMRLLCVIPQMGAGGAERVMSMIANSLSARHDVVLLTWEPPGTQPFYDIARSVRLVQANLFGVGPAAKVAALLSRAVTVRRQIALHHSDVVLSFLDTTNMTAAVACVGTGVPVVVSERVDPAQHDLGRAFIALRLLSYPLADRLVVQTRRVAKYFPQRMQSKIVVLPNPIAEAPTQAAPGTPAATGRFRIVAMGRLVRQKGFDRLVDAFARVASRHPDWDVVIFGEGHERAALEGQVRMANLASRVRLPGVTASAHAELAASHVFAFPSRYEGFPNALGEALVAGLPAVGYDGVSGVEEMILDGKTGVLLPESADSVALANALDLLMGDVELRERMGASALALGGRWEAGKVLEQWEALLVETARMRAGDRAS